MPYFWVILISLVALLLLFGDTRSRNSLFITPEKAASIEYNKWPIWTEIEPADNRIRILWVLHDYVPFVNAGSEICAHQINTFLIGKPYKYDIWLACPGYPKRTFENIRCFDLHDTTTLFEVLNSVNVLCSNTCLYRKQLMWLCRTMGKPYVEWIHTDNYVKAVKQWKDPRIQNRHFVVFNSVSLRNSVPELKDSEDSKDITEIFFPPVDFRFYAVERKPVYVTLSNVNSNKGGELLIQLAKALPEIEFQGIMGGYRKQITYNGLPNLRYIQHTTQIKDVYAQTWVLIMPSKEETWGRTAVEAMSSGIPIIVSPTPGLKECCESAAIYCDRSDLDAWVVTLRKLKNDQGFYNERSTAALARARALDPGPDLERLEKWLDEKVIPSKTKGRMPSTLEKNLLFR